MSNNSEQNTKKDEARKQNKKKAKKSNRIHYTTQQSQNNKVQKSTKLYQKVSLIDKKNDKKSLIDLISDYSKRDWKKTLAMVGAYIVFLGAIISTPTLILHFRAQNQNQTDQFKKGFILNHKLSLTTSLSS